MRDHLRVPFLWGVGCAIFLFVILFIAVHPSSRYDWLILSASAFGVAVLVGGLVFAFEVKWFKEEPPYFIGIAAAYTAFFQLMVWLTNFEDWWAIFFLSLTFFSVIGYTQFWRNWVFWKRDDSAGAKTIIAGTLVALIMLMIYFSAITSVLVTKKYLSTEQDLGSNSTYKLEAYHAWQFLDAIPGLKIPQTLNWAEPKYGFSQEQATSRYVGGALLLLFKLLVIIPVIGAIKYAWDQRKAGKSATTAH
jgi:hypothetical protein